MSITSVFSQSTHKKTNSIPMLTMHSHSNPARAAAYFAEHVASESQTASYYAHDDAKPGAVPGVYFGNGAALLGLTGQPTEQEIQRLFDIRAAITRHTRSQKTGCNTPARSRRLIVSIEQRQRSASSLRVSISVGGFIGLMIPARQSYPSGQYNRRIDVEIRAQAPK